MHLVEHKFRRTINSLVSNGDKILVAVSGGPDSVVLLSLLYDYKKHNPYFSLAIAHLNHLARGINSNADADFVMHMGNKLGLKTFIESINVEALTEDSKTSFQETARIARHNFLNRTLSKWGGNLIALGHNADDQAETLLINMLRGSGLSGLLATPAKKNHLIRPLYDCFRNDIEEYAKENYIAYCNDKSNSEKYYLRNRIRLELIPFLENYNPQIKSSLIETSRLLTDDESFMQGKVNEIMSKGCCNFQKSEYPEFEIKFIKSQHPALQKRLIRQAILFAKGDLRSISSRHILDILHLMNYSVEKREIHLPGNLKAICSDEKLLFCKTGDQVSNKLLGNNEIVPIDIKIPGCTKAGFLNLKFNANVIPMETCKDYLIKTNKAFLDFNKTGSHLKIRLFRSGDSFVPLGMKGRKKLKSFFIDEKVPKNERKSVPILTAQNDDIVWVYEKRIGENYRVTDKTSKILILEGERILDIS